MALRKELLILGFMSLLLKCFLGCSKGLKLMNNECVDIEECTEREIYCGANASCINTNGSYYCQCKSGFRNIRGEINFTAVTGQCKDTNECQKTKDLCGANAKCINAIGSYYCQCRSGFRNIRGEINFTAGQGTCQDMNEFVFKSAAINECQNKDLCGANTNCINTTGSYYCQCKPGFRNISGEINITAGEGMCKDINECENNTLCGENADCNNTIGSYYCQCKPGFRNIRGEINFTAGQGTCQDIDECKNNDVCGENEQCVNSHGSYVCMCRPGFRDIRAEMFRGEVGTCQDINECENNDLCGANTNCINTTGSYYCQCKPGFRNIRGEINFTAGQGTCQDIDECENNDVCGENEECNNRYGSYNCKCRSGFRDIRAEIFPAGAGLCQDINECENNNLCGENADCNNTLGSYYCQCKPGFRNISGEINITAGEGINITAGEGINITTGEGMCKDIDECENDLCGENADCNNTIGSYYCQCRSGFRNIRGENFTAGAGTCQDINECENNDLCEKNADCNNTLGSYYCQCKPGFRNISGEINITAGEGINITAGEGINITTGEGMCKDIDECENDLCGENADCNNAIGSYYCQCRSGFRNVRGENFTAGAGTCQDINECQNNDLCEKNADCANTLGSYYCQCKPGFRNISGEINITAGEGINITTGEGMCKDINECENNDLCGENANCTNTIGSYYCQCNPGFRNIRGVMNFPEGEGTCEWLDCDRFSDNNSTMQVLGGLADVLSLLKHHCLTLVNSSITGETTSGKEMLKDLFTTAVVSLPTDNNITSEHVSLLFLSVETSIRLIGPQLQDSRSKIDTSHTEAEIAVHREMIQPIGSIHLANTKAEVDTDWKTVCGTGPYLGFALAALLTYKNLEGSVNNSFEGLKGDNSTDDTSFKIGSKVVSVMVSNPSTQQLEHPVNITFRHLEDVEELPGRRYVCVYWSEGGTWSTDGCYRQRSNVSHTMCACYHLSSFAVLMALYPVEDTFGLMLVTKIGLIISLVCLTLCILTFKFCRSIKGTRTTIHLHLCICLFMADLTFLAGISQTTPVGGCRFVAAVLHFFFLGVFAWMLLEGVQLYRMVVLVFNTSIRPLYLFITGYGMPLVIVIVSAIIKPTGYGTDTHCWLSLEHGFIWSFLGPVCLIIFVNIFFFIITVSRLAQKFTSLNPDLSTLHKIKAFTVTAIAQMCILGLMWVFGTMLFQEDNIVGSYIFTILNSLQGALVFIMHCLLSKQVREEYAHFFSCICKPDKIYSDLSVTNPSSGSRSKRSRSGQHTGDSQI